MLKLAAIQTSQPDYVALAMVLALAVVIVIMAIRKRFRKKTAEARGEEVQIPGAEVPKPAAPGSAGQVKLNGVEPKIAAMLMAIVADKTGKPLNELRFISIKEVQ